MKYLSIILLGALALATPALGTDETAAKASEILVPRYGHCLSIAPPPAGAVIGLVLRSDCCRRDPSAIFVELESPDWRYDCSTGSWTDPDGFELTDEEMDDEVAAAPPTAPATPKPLATPVVLTPSPELIHGLLPEPPLE